jgi:hypothetical protein
MASGGSFILAANSDLSLLGSLRFLKPDCKSPTGSWDKEIFVSTMPATRCNDLIDNIPTELYDTITETSPCM